MSQQFLRNKLVTAGCAVVLFAPGLGREQPQPKPRWDSPVAEQHYTLTARVRPLLFWISRPGVGGARIAWTEEVDGTRQIELLIGSDPLRTPMKINRWGYIRERSTGSSAELLGIMTESEEESVDQARARIQEAGGRHAFKAIRGRVSDRRAEATVIHMLLAEDFTYRDLERLLLKLPDSGRVTPATEVPESVYPGFLFALKSVIQNNVERLRLSGKTGGGGNKECLFVFNGALYRLTMDSSKLHASLMVNGRRYDSVIESHFRTRKISTGATSSFSISYGSSGPLREVPIRIVYRPRWWFEAELQLTGEPATSLALQEGTSWKPGLK